ncbi:MAG: hypothetical protein ACRDT8_11265 [Micromonosporaceae bacterium]
MPRIPGLRLAGLLAWVLSRLLALSAPISLPGRLRPGAGAALARPRVPLRPP